MGVLSEVNGKIIYATVFWIQLFRHIGMQA
jgi:hypothetical protein